MTGAEVIAKLKEDGWTLDRVHGSHYVMVKNGKALPVPVHGKRDIGVGLLAANSKTNRSN